MAFNLAAGQQAIKDIESGGGNYNAIGPTTASGDNAYGAYQVMGANIPSWTKSATGIAMTPSQFLASPSAQDAVFNQQFGGSVEKYGSVGTAANVWFTGSANPNPNISDGGTTAGSYSSQAQNNYNTYSAAGITQSANANDQASVNYVQDAKQDGPDFYGASDSTNGSVAGTAGAGSVTQSAFDNPNNDPSLGGYTNQGQTLTGDSVESGSTAFGLGGANVASTNYGGSSPYGSLGTTGVSSVGSGMGTSDANPADGVPLTVTPSGNSPDGNISLQNSNISSAGTDNIVGFDTGTGAVLANPSIPSAIDAQTNSQTNAINNQTKGQQQDAKTIAQAMQSDTKANDATATGIASGFKTTFTEYFSRAVFIILGLIAVAAAFYAFGAQKEVQSALRTV